MRLAIIAAALVISAERVSGADGKRPRGVGPEFKKFYQSIDIFTCISNPSITLSFAQVNDDYCDCPDGSDEPGTSACGYLSPLSPKISSHNGVDTNISSALPGFYCQNQGHNPSYIPFTYVNDGICDYELCCDGSDEWAGVGGTKCENKCKEIGKEWKRQDEQKKKSLVAALTKRNELVKESAILKQEIINQIENLSVSIQALEISITDLTKEKEEIERREQGKLTNGKGSGKAGILAGLAKARLNELRELLKKVQEQRDTHKQKVEDLEQILRTFKDEYNPNFNDEGVKRAVQSWENYEAKGAVEATNQAVERELQASLSEGDGIDWEEYENGDVEADVDILYRFEEYLPTSIRSWVHQKISDIRSFLVENGVIAASTTSIKENKAIKDASNRVEAARNSLNKEEEQKRGLENDLVKDYGPDDIFRALKDKCTSTDVGEYTYELCWMKKVHQKPKKGGMSNDMGSFAQFESIVVDEDVRPDGKGLGSGERLVMKFDTGAHCWNGPLRSTAVVMACAESEEIWKVIEEEKCVYRMEVGTPAVCHDVIPTSNQEVKEKDEL